jgi:uncharacterized protein (DUF4415 family)
MKKIYDFSTGKRGPVVPAELDQSPITLYLDNEVIDWFRQQINNAGGGDFQALINATLREHIQRSSGELLEETLRKLIREELRAAS